MSKLIAFVHIFSLTDSLQGRATNNSVVSAWSVCSYQDSLHATTTHNESVKGREWPYRVSHRAHCRKLFGRPWLCRSGTWPANSQGLDSLQMSGLARPACCRMPN